MNVYEKLQKCRVEIHESGLKKSGQNKFSGYDYFELDDFLPTANKLFMSNGLCGIITFTKEEAILTIINTEDTEQKIIFSSPMATAQLKGCHEVQNIGASQTYLRRYLYMNALDIVENDPLNIDGAEPEPEDPKIDKIKIETLRSMMEKTGTQEPDLLGYYLIEKIEDMPVSVFIKAMSALEAKERKAKKIQPKLDI